jgi:type 1 fimbriae regulatory protein FimB
VSYIESSRDKTSLGCRLLDRSTIEEIEWLLEVDDLYGRHRVRNHLMVLLGFRHGLRREEISLLRWDEIDWLNGQISIHRGDRGESDAEANRGGL